MDSQSRGDNKCCWRHNIFSLIAENQLTTDTGAPALQQDTGLFAERMSGAYGLPVPVLGFRCAIPVMDLLAEESDLNTCLREALSVSSGRKI